MTVGELMPYLRTHWARIREEMREGRYRPQPVLLVEIPKPGGRGMRRLGIPTVVDRMIQQALLQVLQPRIDQETSALIVHRVLSLRSCPRQRNKPSRRKVSARPSAGRLWDSCDRRSERNRRRPTPSS